MSDYIVNTLKTLVQFTQPFTTRYILETFQMLPCHSSNMCLQNNISNVSRILPQMFPTCTQKSHGDQSEKIGLMLNTFTMCQCNQDVSKMAQCSQHVPIRHMVEIFWEHFRQHFECYE